MLSRRESTLPSRRKYSLGKLFTNSLCDTSDAGSNRRDFSTDPSAIMKSNQCATSSSWPKLGDFRKLYHEESLRCSSLHGHIETLTHDANCVCFDRQPKSFKASFSSDVKLGDFRKVRRELRQIYFESCPDVFPIRSEVPSIPQTQMENTKLHEEEKARPPNGGIGHMQPTDPILRPYQPTVRLPNLPSNRLVDLVHIPRDAGQEPDVCFRENTFETEMDSVDLPRFETPQTMRSTAILSYKLADRGPISPILGTKLSLDQQHESLTLRLVPLRAGDVSIEANNNSIAPNGVHVFLDMSNINISFQHALRQKYSIKEHARFVPLPQLNLQLLTEILVRNRRTITLNAGCSVLPNRQEPRFVQELRNLGYRVDLRERKRINETRAPGGSGGRGDASCSDELADLHKVARFMEDLVDETLQTRIAESVMEYFDSPGTLVLATGDAQPARYSDGFFMYAERALRMGWYVEVVSWSMSLSSRWRKSGLTQRWGDRFRLIRLDDFLDELLLL